MSLTEPRIVDVFGLVLVGMVTTVGAIVASLLVTGVVQAGLRAAGWLGRFRSRAAGAGRDVATATGSLTARRNFRLDRPADHALLARQAWWRLRC